MSFFSRVLNLARTGRVERDLDAEQQFHLDARVDELVAGGMSPERARTEATRRFGGRLRTRETSRDVKLVPWLESIARDLRFAARLWRRDALVSAAAVVSLALALGACAAAFSLVDALILRPLPVAEPQRLVSLVTAAPAPDRPPGQSFSFPIFAHLRDATRHELDLFLVSGRNTRAAVLPDGGGQRERLLVQFVSGNAFGVLGLRAAQGRLIGPSDDVSPGAHPVTVLSHSLWMRRFGGDPAIIGRRLTIGTQTLEVIGVAEAPFAGIEPGVRIDLWLPAMMYEARAFTAVEWNWFRIMGRLKPGVDATRALAAVQPAFTDIRREIAAGFGSRPRDHVERYLRTAIDVVPAATGPSPLRYRFQRPLLVLSAIAGLVLLIAASNVANLLLARAAAREREMSLRLSIGAGRARLVQQMLVESSLLAAASSVLGLAVAALAGPAVLRMLAPAADPVYLDLRIDGRLVAFLVGLGSVVTLLFGLAPALRASRAAPIGVSGAVQSRATARNAILQPLVAVQMAVSVTVLFLAGLLLVSFGRLLRVDLGFDKASVLLVEVQSDQQPGPGQDDPASTSAITTQLLDRVRTVPGVQSASLSTWPMFTQGGWTNGVRIPGRPPNDGDPIVHLGVSPGFVGTMRMRLMEGRDFTRHDRATPTGSPVIVNESFARRYFPGERVVGQRYERPGNNRIVAQEIVGVVADAKYNDPREPAPPTVFVPLTGFGTLQVRTAGDPLALGTLVRREVLATHPSLWVSGVTLQSALVDNALIPERLLAVLSGFFGAIGLLLAIVGLYGVLSYAVVRRTREIGIRMSLGAPRVAVVRAVMTKVGAMTMVGAAVGLGGGLFFARFVRTWLFEVTPLDVSSLVLPVAALLAAAAAAAIVPALRATRVDPVVALRAE